MKNEEGTCKNVSLVAADGGYILQYDEYTKSENATYDGMCYNGQKRIIFEDKDGAKALEALKEYGAKEGNNVSLASSKDKSSDEDE